jgi:uncharacterized protein YecT (DUF1311 family)
MRQITIIGVGFAILFPLLSIAKSVVVVKGGTNLYDECGAYSQQGMKECLVKKVDDSQEFLKKAEADAFVAIKKWDDEGKYIRASGAALAISNREFIKYRTAQCKFSASLSGGAAGNAYEMGRLACVAELNMTRAAQLRDAVSNLPLK